ncbi:hypothetical protein WH47_03379 [Habropoda laboriosa]|uniref:Uncharacterized protein n=1 Tax=Habropoda laboriosa TaxID=597456 RepID=A0A0L7RBT8_9HYME|nr:hypothetical protein WH47_03379 [Habropoda laboriosa]
MEADLAKFFTFEQSGRFSYRPVDNNPNRVPDTVSSAAFFSRLALYDPWITTPNVSLFLSTEDFAVTEEGQKKARWKEEAVEVGREKRGTDVRERGWFPRFEEMGFDMPCVLSADAAWWRLTKFHFRDCGCGRSELASGVDDKVVNSVDLDRETGVAIDKDRSGESGGNGKFVRPRTNLDASCALLRLLEDEGKS